MTEPDQRPDRAAEPDQGPDRAAEPDQRPDRAAERDQGPDRAAERGAPGAPAPGPLGPEVLVADATPVFLAGALAILRGAGFAARAIEPAALALPLASGAGRPALVLDASLGAEPAARDLVARFAGPADAAVVLVVERLAGPHLLDALDAGALGLLHRRCQADELLAAVTAALAGSTWVAPPIAALLRSEARARRAGSSPASLTRREQEVLRRLATGATNVAIGQALGISEHTVRNHVRAILAKLAVANRTDAVTTALRRGLVDLPG